jgi:hypothetical protein
MTSAELWVSRRDQFVARVVNAALSGCRSRTISICADLSTAEPFRFVKISGINQYILVDLTTFLATHAPFTPPISSSGGVLVVRHVEDAQIVPRGSVVVFWDRSAKLITIHAHAEDLPAGLVPKPASLTGPPRSFAISAIKLIKLRMPTPARRPSDSLSSATSCGSSTRGTWRRSRSPRKAAYPTRSASTSSSDLSSSVSAIVRRSRTSFRTSRSHTSISASTKTRAHA